MPRDPSPFDAPRESSSAVRLAMELRALLPDVSVEARPTPGRIRRALRSAATQMADVVHLDVDLGEGEPRLRLAVPDRPGLSIDGVARAVATTVGVRRSFGPAASHIYELSFDNAETGFGSGHVAGTAHTGLGHIHLNVGFVLPAGVADRPRSPADQDDPFTARRSAGRRSMRSDILEAVTAHECWHQVENAFELRHFAERMEFKRELGEYFGVATLEHVILGRDRDAPPERRAARAQLIREVSRYATTNIRESTAEMMMLWWCAPDPAPPLAILWDSLMERYFRARRPPR